MVELTPEEKQKVYLEEKAREEARQKLAKERAEESRKVAQKSRLKGVTAWGQLIASLFLFMFGGMMFTQRSGFLMVLGVLFFILGFYLLIKSFRSSVPTFLCANCGYQGKAKYGRSQPLELILFLFFFIPGVIYHLATPNWKCPNCDRRI